MGHLYLRRWGRAAAWLLVVAATSLVVPQAAIEALAAGEAVDVVALAPVWFASTLCALDAYVVARRDHTPRTTAAADTARCPHCGGELTDGLDFCHWCTTELDDAQVASSGGGSR
nr:zinc ribbon domain-containing protein [Halomarina rubra]